MWSDHWFMSEAFYAAREARTNEAGDPSFAAPQTFKAHVEDMEDTEDRGTGQSDKSTIALITSTRLRRGDFVWVPGTHPDTDEPLPVLSVEPFKDPLTGELHHYEVGL